MKSLPWFRLYTEMIDDEKLGLLAFEDRWHFVALLCLKGKGVLDSEDDMEMLQRKAALKMGLTVNELEKVVSRLARMGLVDKDTLQPAAWDVRQMQSDNSSERVRAYRERMKPVKRDGNVSVTAQDTDTDTDKEEKRKTAVSTPEGVSITVWQDFKTLRTKQRAPITDTAMAGIKREADIAGLTLNDALQMCCERSWRGFKADWANGAAKPSQAIGVFL